MIETTPNPHNRENDPGSQSPETQEKAGTTSKPQEDRSAIWDKDTQFNKETEDLFNELRPREDE